MMDVDAHRKRCAQIAIDNRQTWRYSTAGSIVCDCPPDCPEKDDSNEQFYGGHFVGESMSPDVAAFIIAAVCVAPYRPTEDRS